MPPAVVESFHVVRYAGPGAAELSPVGNNSNAPIQIFFAGITIQDIATRPLAQKLRWNRRSSAAPRTRRAGRADYIPPCGSSIQRGGVPAERLGRRFVTG